MSSIFLQNDSMPYSFTMTRGLLLVFLFYSGLLPFVPLGESLLQFYLPRVINKCVSIIYMCFFHCLFSLCLPLFSFSYCICAEEHTFLKNASSRANWLSV